MSWLDDMFSLMRNFERIAKENEQFLNMCEQNAKHLNTIASSSAIQMADGAESHSEQIPHFTIAELIERQESLAKTIESLSHSPWHSSLAMEIVSMLLANQIGRSSVHGFWLARRSGASL